MAEVAGTVMDQRLQPLQPRLVETDMDGVVATGPLLQRVQAALVAGADRVAHGLGGAAQVLGDGRWPFAAGAGQQDLAAAEGEGIGRAHACLQDIALVVREWTHVQRWFHPPSSHIMPHGITLGTVRLWESVAVKV